MRWKKLGRLYAPEAIHPKLATHAANPLPVLLQGDIYRVFFSGRDVHNRSSVGFVDIDIIKRAVIRVCERPAFEHGPEDSYYSDGVSIGNCYRANGRNYILFMGWQCPPVGHWRGDIGRLELAPDFSLSLTDDRPFMATSTIDPVSMSYPWVLQEPDGRYAMWYGSTLSWDAGNGEMLHVIQHASSDDGHAWHQNGLAVPYILGEAQAFSHPSVVGNRIIGFHMWFSFRGGADSKYRIGYAYSKSGETWELKLAKAGIDVSASGWDSEMIEYPFVFEHRERCYMLYNGNDYGWTGFGLAVLVDECIRTHAAVSTRPEL